MTLDEIVTAPVEAKVRRLHALYADGFAHRKKVHTMNDLVQELDDTPFNERRFGAFSMPTEWLRGMREGDAQQVFKQFRIVRAEMILATDSVEYVAASFLFDPVLGNEKPPGYTIMVGRDSEDGPLDIRVRRD